MELTKDNQQQALTSLRDKGLFALVSHIENTLKINQEDYEEGTEYGIDKGYGARVYLIIRVEEYVTVLKRFNLIGVPEDIVQTIFEEDHTESYYMLYITGSDNSVCIYCIGEDEE